MMHRDIPHVPLVMSLALRHHSAFYVILLVSMLETTGDHFSVKLMHTLNHQYCVGTIIHTKRGNAFSARYRIDSETAPNYRCRMNTPDKNH